MNGNDKMLETYLYENRISPPPEFSARIDRVCEKIRQREATGAGARENRIGKGRKARHTARRILLAAACLLIVAGVTVMAISSARAAVTDWLEQYFSAGDYLGQESETRSAEPAMDAIITKIGDDGREITVSDIYDSDAAREMAENFGIRLDEVAYTGDTIYITGWFTRTSGKFLLDPYTGGDTWHEGNEFTEGSLTLTLPDGTVYYGTLGAYFDDEMNQILGDTIDSTQMEYDADGNLVTANAKADEEWYQWLSENEVRFIYEATPESAVTTAAPLTGQVEANLSFKQYYYDVENDTPVVLFKADLGTVTIDADAYTAVSHTSEGDQFVTLSGTHRLFVQEWEYAKDETYIHSYVRDLDMSGVTISVGSVSFTPAGLEVTLGLDLPESWTRAERIAAAQGGPNGGIDFIILIDGEEVSHPFLSIGSKSNASTSNKDDPFLTSPREFSNSSISPSQWDEIKTITFIPCTGWPGEASVVEVGSEEVVIEPTKLDPGAVVTAQVNKESTQLSDWQEERMDDCAITINLDDYR